MPENFFYLVMGLVKWPDKRKGFFNFDTGSQPYKYLIDAIVFIF